MLVHTGYRYRLDVGSHQSRRFGQLAGACRWIWNFFLAYREDAYLAAKAAGGTLPKGAFTYAANCKRLTVLKKLIPWLAEADAVALQQCLKDLDAAFTSFFEGRTGFPQRRSRGNDSYRVCGKANFGIDGHYVRLPKLGWIPFRKSRDLPSGRILNVTVSQDGAHWNVAFCVEHDIAKPAQPAGEAIGLDLGIAQSITDSNGTVYHFPVPTDTETRFLRRLTRQISRKKLGSRRRRRAIARRAKFQRHLTNRRRDYVHKLTTKLSRTHQEIHVEDLKLRNMTRSAKGTADEPGANVRQKAGLNRSLLSQAHGETVRFLEYKCVRSGTNLVKIDPRHSSQECTECHHIAPENRPSQAVFSCLKCGYTTNADHNAARVSLHRQPTGGYPVPARRRLRHKAPNDARTHPTQAAHAA